MASQQVALRSSCLTGNEHQFCPTLQFLIRLILGSTFLVSSVPKLSQPFDFLNSVYAYELVSPELGMVVASVVPWLELLLAILLLGGIFLEGALLASTCLVAVFVFVQGTALYKGLDISCACFSTGGHESINYLSVTRTLGLLALAGLAYWFRVLHVPRQDC